MEIQVKILKTPDALNDAFLIREEVFMKEQGFQNEFDDTDQISWHAVAYEEKIPAACGRLFCKRAGTYTIGRVAVRRPFRGKYLGELIMKSLEEQAKELGAKKIELSAQCQAAGFYEKLGYQTKGKEYLDEFCPHIMMQKNL